MNFAIDLDGTLSAWVKGDDNRLEVGDWLPGAQSALRALDDDGHRIVIHSCRATWPEGGGIKAIARFLTSGGFFPNIVSDHEGKRATWIPFKAFDHYLEDPPFIASMDNLPEGAPIIGIWHGRGKPIAHIYIDDRAYAFSNWGFDLPLLRAVVMEMEKPQGG